MEKIIVCIMGQNCEKFIGMCLESVKDADSIVYCDGGSTDNTLNIVDAELSGNNENILTRNLYIQEDKGMNGKQRNHYLKILKENYPNDWALCLDADEILEDGGIQKIRDFIKEEHLHEGKNVEMWSPRMRHLISDLAHEDSIEKIHYVLNRLFKISDADKYPEVEHPVLQPKARLQSKVDCITVWHMAYVPNVWDYKKRYDNHMKKSDMHTPEFLKEWYFSHIFGEYPNTPFHPQELPTPILKEFGIEKDELYFAHRKLEAKHFLDAIHWKDYFKCKTALEWGCGLGPRVYAMNNVGIDAEGIELSKWAVKHSLIPNKIIQGDLAFRYFYKSKVDLIIAYDVLEHLPYDKLDDAIINLIKGTKKHILVSMPFIGDPNLERDPTHIIKEKRSWWIKQFTDKGCRLVFTPKNFIYQEQLLILEVDNAIHKTEG